VKVLESLRKVLDFFSQNSAQGRTFLGCCRQFYSWGFLPVSKPTALEHWRSNSRWSLEHWRSNSRWSFSI